MVPNTILLMSTMRESGMLVRGQDGAGCTTLMDQYMKGSGTMEWPIGILCQEFMKS